MPQALKSSDFSDLASTLQLQLDNAIDVCDDGHYARGFFQLTKAVERTIAKLLCASEPHEAQPCPYCGCPVPDNRSGCDRCGWAGSA